MPDSPTQFQPRSLKGDDAGLTIVWSDDVAHQIPWTILRQVCPCATCRTEEPSTSEPEADNALPILTAAEARPLKATEMRPVGNYAYAVNFTDGHNTGIYTLDLLRRVGEEIADARTARTESAET